MIVTPTFGLNILPEPFPFYEDIGLKSLTFTCPHSQQRPRSRHHVFANIFEKIKKFEKPFCLCSYWAQEEFDDKKGSKSHDIVPLKRWHRTKNILFTKKTHFI